MTIRRGTNTVIADAEKATKGGPLVTRICVVGSGYVGTVVAACLAELGHSVVGLEVDVEKLRHLLHGRPPFHEIGLEPLLQSGLSSGRLRFTNRAEDAVPDSDAIFLCVGTPNGPNGRPDLREAESVLQDIGPALTGSHVIVAKSTMPIGTGNWLASMLDDVTRLNDSGPTVSVVSNPEFLREGSAVQDFLHPDRVVLGGEDLSALDLVESLYRPILDQDFPGGWATRPALLRTTLTTAEAIKYAANSFLATKISFINELAHICERVGADVTEVAAGIGLDKRIGSDFLRAGVGWGGGCFGKDVQALVSIADDFGYSPRILKAVVAVNADQRGLVIDKLQRHLYTLRGRRIALLGLAFKPDTDDLRDAPAVDLAYRLVSAGARVTAHDPVVQSVPNVPAVRREADPYAAVHRADATVLMTDWEEYIGLDLGRLADEMRGDLFLDGRNMFSKERVEAAGLYYEAIGRSMRPARKACCAHSRSGETPGPRQTAVRGPGRHD